MDNHPGICGHYPANRFYGAEMDLYHGYFMGYRRPDLWAGRPLPGRSAGQLDYIRALLYFWLHYPFHLLQFLPKTREGYHYRPDYPALGATGTGGADRVYHWYYYMRQGGPDERQR